MRRSVHGWLVLALVAVLPASAAESSQGRAVDALFAEFNRAGSPGLAVGIYRNGRQIYAAGYGHADLENNVAITPRTVFHIASVSKQFVAFSAALLEHEGKLDLDGDLRQYLPYVPDFGHRITPRHLIYHTSGLRDQWSLFAFGGRDMSDRLRQVHVINMVGRQRALNFTPGSDHSYSNTGYTLLAEVVKAVSGRTLREFTDARIFRPLDMQDTLFYDDVTEIVPNRAQSYWKVEGKWHRVPLNYENVGATSLHTTVGDMLKWAGNFARPVAGNAELIREISRMGQLDDGTPINYGFGLTREIVAGHDALVHSGADAGFYSRFAYLPEQDFAVVLLANNWMDLASYLEKIVALHFDGSATSASQPLPAAIRPKRVLLQAVQGNYMRPGGALLMIRAEAGGAVMSRLNSPAEQVIFRVDGTFDDGDKWRRLGDFYRPVFDSRGRVTAVEYGGVDTVQGKVYRLQRVERAAPSIADLNQLVGEYHSAELDITYRIVMTEGKLTIGSSGRRSRSS